MAAEHLEDLADIRQLLLASGAPLSPHGMAGYDTELMRFAFTTGLTHARTPQERYAPCAYAQTVMSSQHEGLLDVLLISLHLHRTSDFSRIEAGCS